MSERLASIRRIQKVHAAVRDLATAKLGVAERKEAELAAARVALENFIAAENLTGGFAVLAGDMVRRLSAREIEAARRRAALVEATRAAEGRLRMADKLVGDVARAEREARERKDLEALVEAMIAQGARNDGLR